MIQTAKNSCYKCEKRQVGCHGSCEDYLAWRAEQDKVLENRTRERLADEITIGLVMSCKARAERRKKWKTKPTV